MRLKSCRSLRRATAARSVMRSREDPFAAWERREWCEARCRGPCQASTGEGHPLGEESGPYRPEQTHPNGDQACGCKTCGCQTTGGAEASRSGHAQTSDQQAGGGPGEIIGSTGTTCHSSETTCCPGATDGSQARATACRGQAPGRQQAGCRQTGTGEQTQGCCQTHGTHAAANTSSPGAAPRGDWKSSTAHPWPGSAQAPDHPRRRTISAQRSNACRRSHKARSTFTAHHPQA